jgi:hypothetical protein
MSSKSSKAIVWRFDFNDVQSTLARDALLSEFPNAMSLLDYLDQYKAIPEGLMITNHVNIEPWPITKTMLENHFPSYMDAVIFYVTEPVPVSNDECIAA